MPSPFPGMNPYFEQKSDWHDFHLNFVARMQEAICKQISEDYFVTTNVRLILHERSAEERKYSSAVDVEKRYFLEIRRIVDRCVVTAIELLCPSDKKVGIDFDEYDERRWRVMKSEIHFVEVDLLRGGTRPTAPPLPPCDYYTLVSRFEDRPEVCVWPFGLRDPLPIVPIPLLKPDPDVSLDLKAVLDHTYDAIGFGHRIYFHEPEPPLSAEDAEWAKKFVPKRKR